MNKNFKLMTIAVTLVGFVARGYTPSLAASPTGGETGASQIARARRAGIQNVPEASLYWGNTLGQENGASQIIRIAGLQNVPEASLFLGDSTPSVSTMMPAIAKTSNSVDTVSFVRQPALHESDAAQIARIAGIQNVPEASLFWGNTLGQENGASQIARVTGNTNFVEAALFLGPHASGTNWVTLVQVSGVEANKN